MDVYSKRMEVLVKFKSILLLELRPVEKRCTIEQLSSRQFVLFANVLVCEGIESETSHSLLTCPVAKLSPDCQQPFQTCSGGHHKQASSQSATKRACKLMVSDLKELFKAQRDCFFTKT